MQAFLTTPKYNKFYIYKTPTNQHQRFCNAFGYSRMVNTGNPAYQKLSLCTECTERFSVNLSKKSKAKSRNTWQPQFPSKVFCEIPLQNQRHYLKAPGTFKL